MRCVCSCLWLVLRNNGVPLPGRDPSRLQAWPLADDPAHLDCAAELFRAGDGLLSVLLNGAGAYGTGQHLCGTRKAVHCSATMC